MAATVRHLLVVIVLAVVTAVPAVGQTPQPFPRPGDARTPRTSAPEASRPAPPPPVSQPPPAAAPPPEAVVPTAEVLVFPVYPTAQFFASYDAGRGQRYYLFGTTAAFADIVSYYRTQLDERGTFVFKEPPTYMFEVGRFREETMAFPPGVTVKDCTWGGSQGYPNPRPGGKPVRFPTVIMITPPPPQAAAR